MKHSFICLEEGTVKYNEYYTYLQHESNINFRDDFMRYISDTLSWIPSIHIAGMQYKKSSGLFLDGCTIVNQNGALLLENAIKCWTKLFAVAPESFELTGPALINADNQFQGDFYKIHVERDRLVENLDRLSKEAQKVTRGKHYLLHIGL
ncbi:hypothetical protein QGP82_25455 [Leptothoe sp. LEGE 181152]|nr:hypothetical protein [Leptothoe sp. LEGE 181152]